MLPGRNFQIHYICLRNEFQFVDQQQRRSLLAVLAAQPSCAVAMEACATAHGWGREIEKLGHTVRLIPTAYVKPFVKRQKNDLADAEAIAEAASRLQVRERVQKANVEIRDIVTRCVEQSWGEANAIIQLNTAPIKKKEKTATRTQCRNQQQ